MQKFKKTASKIIPQIQKLKQESALTDAHNKSKILNNQGLIIRLEKYQSIIDFSYYVLKKIIYITLVVILLHSYATSNFKIFSVLYYLQEMLNKLSFL